MKKITKKELVDFISRQTIKLVQKAVLSEQKERLEMRLSLLEGHSYQGEFEYVDNDAATAELNKTYLVKYRITPGQPASYSGGPGGLGSAQEPNDVELLSVIDLDNNQEVINTLTPELLAKISLAAESRQEDNY